MVETKSSKRGGWFLGVVWPHNFSSYGSDEKDISLQSMKQIVLCLYINNLIKIRMNNKSKSVQGVPAMDIIFIFLI